MRWPLYSSTACAEPRIWPAGSSVMVQSSVSCSAAWNGSASVRITGKLTTKTATELRLFKTGFAVPNGFTVAFWLCIAPT